MTRVRWRGALGEGGHNAAGLRALLATDRSLEPLPDPKPREWLAIHEEHGQTFDEFVETAVRPSPAERTIYIQPFDDLAGLSDTCLQTLASFAGAFFGLEVRVLQRRALDPDSLAPRWAPDGPTRQVRTGLVLHRLLAAKPPDAFCVLGLTAHDLYPHPIVSFAFGEASSTCRVGVCSVARYGPPYCQDAPGDQQGAMRRRCCRVIAHEIGHMAGIQHCVYFRCLMNGSASLDESDRRPLHLCPIDLRKLQWLLGFNLAERYRRLAQFWREAGDPNEAEWAVAHMPTSSLGWRRLAAHFGLAGVG